jgi:hypothetical protein
MSSLTPRPVFVVTAGFSPGAIPTEVVAYSRLMPELSAKGPTPEEAIGRLVDRLTQALDDAPDEFHRAAIRNALDDARGDVPTGGGRR